MNFNDNLSKVHTYFDNTLKNFGATPQGADWNSPRSQECRFDQLLKILEVRESFSILDYGCGYGALADYMDRQGFKYDLFVGYDILESMIDEARSQHAGADRMLYTANPEEIPMVDYAVASGVFNIKLDASYEDWTRYTLDSLADLLKRTRRGFSVNFLTKYSDADRMAARPDLYYADPLFLFDYCKRNFSRNVALLHDYGLYDFTLLVRKLD